MEGATRSLIIRVCATVVLAACLVSGLATGIRDAAAVVSAVTQLDDLAFGSVAGDVDLAGTVVVDDLGGKSVTGGVVDLGGGNRLGGRAKSPQERLAAPRPPRSL